MVSISSVSLESPSRSRNPTKDLSYKYWIEPLPLRASWERGISIIFHEQFRHYLLLLLLGSLSSLLLCSFLQGPERRKLGFVYRQASFELLQLYISLNIKSLEKKLKTSCNEKYINNNIKNVLLVSLTFHFYRLLSHSVWGHQNQR